jgi:hypothetical protein
MKAASNYLSEKFKKNSHTGIGGVNVHNNTLCRIFEPLTAKGPASVGSDMIASGTFVRSFTVDSSANAQGALAFLPTYGGTAGANL